MKKQAEKSFSLQLHPINSSCVKIFRPFPVLAHLGLTSTQPVGLSYQMFNYSAARLILACSLDAREGAVLIFWVG